MSACRLGILALGDSITNGGGELQWGVALHSWAQWVARGLALPYTGLAIDGARAHHVLSEQVPHVPAGARYDLGCLYVGVNDVRAPEWEREPFERAHRAALAVLGEHCDRVLTMTVPLDLGRPRAGEKVREVNAAIAASAAAEGALVVDLSGFGARNHVMTDHVHPTAFGQIAIAERALAVLAADGLPTRVPPSTLIHYETTPWKRLRGDLTYVYRHLKVSGRAAWDRRRAARSDTGRSGM